MAIWAVFNGWIGESAVAVLVDSPTEDDAMRQAREVLREKAIEHCPDRRGRKSYATPTHAEVLELPAFVELGGAE